MILVFFLVVDFPMFSCSFQEQCVEGANFLQGYDYSNVNYITTVFGMKTIYYYLCLTI